MENYLYYLGSNIENEFKENKRVFSSNISNDIKEGDYFLIYNNKSGKIKLSEVTKIDYKNKTIYFKSLISYKTSIQEDNSSFMFYIKYFKLNQHQFTKSNTVPSKIELEDDYMNVKNSPIYNDLFDFNDTENFRDFYLVKEEDLFLITKDLKHLDIVFLLENNDSLTYKGLKLFKDDKLNDYNVIISKPQTPISLISLRSALSVKEKSVNKKFTNEIIDDLQKTGFFKQQLNRPQKTLYNIFLAKTRQSDIKAQLRNDLNKGIIDEKTSYLINNFMKSENLILYGVPGSGKSYTIKSKIAGVFEINEDQYIGNEETYEDEINNNYKQLEDNGQIKRIVFHPDYTYSDFVGQVLPTLDDNKNIRYEFKSGPFTQALKAAITNPNKEHFLIIEEINRGNAAAIFGDIFQLLDRKENGESEYTINNEDIENEINKEIIERNKKEENKKDLLVESISIPSNLWLLATMNTSDQNVYTLDTAFQRRWNMELIPNDLENKNPKLDFAIEGLNIKWLPFAKVVNKILEGSSNSFSGGDKRLGAWFIRPDKDEENTKLISKELFANKVLKYLWDDAFKYNTSEFFSEKCKTLENVIINYKKDNFDTLSLFADKVKEELEKNSIKKPDTLLSDESE